MAYTKGDGTITFTQNVTNTLFHMAFIVTDSPDGGSMVWWDEPPRTPSVFGTESEDVGCYLRTATAPDHARFSGLLDDPGVPGAPGVTHFLIEVKEGGSGTGAVRVRVGDATATNCAAPSPAFPNSGIDGPLATGEIHIYYP